MERIRGAIYDEAPDDVVFHVTSVDVVQSVKPYKRTDESSGVVYRGYLVDLDRYTMDEYFKEVATSNMATAAEVTSAQLALAELYEMIIGGEL